MNVSEDERVRLAGSTHRSPPSSASDARPSRLAPLARDAGFATKLFMFQASVTDELLWLVGLAVLNSFISLYYYLMVLRQMYLFHPEDGLARFRVAPVLWVTGAALMLGVVFIGIYPSPAFQAAESATERLYEGVDAGALQAR